MTSRAKLKGPTERFVPKAVFAFLVLVVIEIVLTGKSLLSVVAFGAFFIILGIFQFIRTGLWSNLIIGLLFGTGTWHSLVKFYEGPFTPTTYFIQVPVTLFALFLAWPVLWANERLETNARRLFRLAAEQVRDATDGFTGRPYAAGGVSASRDEILGLARFLKAKYIAWPVVRAGTVTLFFSMGRSVLKDPEAHEVSSVSIDAEGCLSVRIAEADYRMYKPELAFDQLCASLGDVFQRFLGYYQKGLDERIVLEIKAASR